MKFIDEVVIVVQSGNGGPGAVSWRREKFVPRGGPDGGDGGRGGSVIFKVDDQLNSLLDFYYKKTYSAENGIPGAQQNMTGADGAHMVLRVPPGTVVKSISGEVLLDLEKSDNEHIFLEGGRGGKGNHFFKTSINQAPTHAQPGESGQKLEVRLELKLMADVGIIGYPNAGKSTLISKLSAAKPKIADYPFTTLTPSLGVVRFGDDRSFVLADIPGLIPGAHKGVGLGIKFLKHIERTRCFVHLVDASGFSGRDPLKDYDDIMEELHSYDELGRDGTEIIGGKLCERPQIVVLNKMDVAEKEAFLELENQFRRRGVQIRKVSALSGFGLRELTFEVGNLVFNSNSKEDGK